MLPKRHFSNKNGTNRKSGPVKKRAIVEPNKLIAFNKNLRESKRKTTRMIPANHANKMISLKNQVERATLDKYSGDPKDSVRSQMVLEAESRKNLIIWQFENFIAHLNKIRLYDNDQKRQERQDWKQKRKLVNKINSILDDNLNDSDSSIDMELTSFDIPITELNLDVSIEDINIEVFDVFQ